MKQYLMRTIERTPIVGSFYRKLERRLFFRHVTRIRAEAGACIALISDNTVSAGVFAGMKIHPLSAWGVDQFTILSGQYESELHSIISNAAVNDYDAFIDIGCANGFYAVGFAMISKNCTIIAYDISEDARRTTRLNAELNCVAGRIIIKDLATHCDLQATIEPYDRVFVLADVEGAEADLIDPQRCPVLRRCDLLVEVHGRTDEVAASLLNRFKETHEGSLIGRAPRNPFAFDYLSCQFEDEAWVTVSEGRGFTKNNWVHLTRRQAA